MGADDIPSGKVGWRESVVELKSGLTLLLMRNHDLFIQPIGSGFGDF